LTEDGSSKGPNYANIKKNDRGNQVTNLETGNPWVIGQVHISRAKVRDRADYAMFTYIHEMTHRYGGTIDYGDKGYIWLTKYLDGNGVEFRQGGLTTAEAVCNADSYALFVDHICRGGGLRLQ
jgi:hypothetical protein